MTLVLAAATALEMRAALKSLGTADVPERGAVRAFLADREMLLLVTGVGPVNAALEIGGILGQFDVSGVIHVGLAGSYDERLAPLGSAVLATAEAYPEYGVAGDDGLAQTTAFPFAQWERGEQRVFQRIALQPDEAAAALELTLSSDIRRGTFLTVAGVTGTPHRALTLASRHEALAENMEGFPVALAAFMRNVPYLELRTISNGVGERDRSRWTFKEALWRLESAVGGLFA